MGYYSQLYFDLIKAKVDKEKLAKVKEYFTTENDEVYGFYGVDFEVDENGNLLDIVLEDYYAKFYDDEIFAEQLSKAIVEGQVDLEFTGEDGTKWCYRVSKGKVEELHLVWLTRTELEKVMELFSSKGG